MSEIFEWTVMGLVWIVLSIGRATSSAWRSIKRVAGGVIQRLANRRAKDAVIVAVGAPLSAEQSLQARLGGGAGAPRADLTAERYVVADRVYIVTFPRGWSATVRVFKASGLVTRVMRCSDAETAVQLQHAYIDRVFPLSDVKLEGTTIEAILRDTEKVGGDRIAALLAGLGKVHHQAFEPEAEHVREEPASQAVLPTTGAMPDGPMLMEAPSASVEKAAESRRPAKVIGRVVSASKEVTAGGEGSTFQVVLDTPKGEKVFRGAMLHEIFTRDGIRVNETIAITALGRQPVVVQNDNGPAKTFQKNVFEVNRMETISE